MRRFVLLTLIVFCFFSLFAQNEGDSIKPWRKGVNVSLAFSQTSLSNWTAGGENALAANGFLNVFADYKKGKSLWENRMDLAYGLTKQGDQEIRKNDDKIDLSSKYGYKATRNWYYSTMFNFRTQFANGYDYPEDTSILVSKFLAPAYISIGLGMDWKPGDCFSLYISPVTTRWVVVNDQDLADAGAFGLEPAVTDNGTIIQSAKKVKTELGAMVRAEFMKDIVKNVNLKTKVEVFSDYLNDPQNIDVFWDMFLTLKANKWLSATLNTTLIYDHDIMITDKDGNVGPRTQFKEVFGIGITYNLGASLEE